MLAMIEYQEGPPETILEMLDSGHAQDEQKHGVPCNFKKFALVVKEDQKVVGALVAYTAFAEIYVDDIWIDPSHRKQGLGRKLLEDLEKRFTGQGFNNINLVTSHFQAPGFYKSCGFELEFVRKNKQDPKFDKYFYVKFFDN